ncbi:hypothetical protein PG993_000230 [Apiospora rasikravindrae]|uniref:F-box domain-containing protein n=1 Tax=Apiospora rasikravindrae TaxID=990691 RepID=A0ABR1U7W9_9PEZI
MVLPQLPPEIWRHICNQLTDDNYRLIGTELADLLNKHVSIHDHLRAKNALAALSLVSKSIGEMALHARFKCFHMDFSGDRRVFLKFLRRVLDDPRLAACVKELSVYDWICIKHPANPRSDEADAAATYARMAARLGVDTAAFPFDVKELSPHRNPAGRVPGIILLTLPLLPNLGILRVGIGRERRPFELLRRLRASGVVRPFERVRDLTLASDGDGYGINLTRFSPLLALCPNVATLRLVECTGFDLRERDFVRAVRESMPRRIRALEVRDSRFDDRSMNVLLACVVGGSGGDGDGSSRGLERFYYRSERASCEPPAVREVTPKQLARQLLRAKATLREIELDYSDPGRERQDDGDSEEYRTRLTVADDFAEFPVLERFVHLTKGDSVDNDPDWRDDVKTYNVQLGPV